MKKPATAERIKKRIRELQRENNLLKTVIESSHDCEIYVNIKGETLYVTPSFTEITGYPIKPILDNCHFFYTLIHPEDFKRFSEHEQEVFSTPQHHVINFRIITKDMQVKWINHECSPMYDKKGKWIGQRSTNKEITEFKLIESQAKIYRIQLDALLVSIPLPFFANDLLGNYIMVNQALLNFFGISKEQIIGKNASQIWYEKDYKIYNEMDTQLIEQGGIQVFEHTLTNFDGNLFNVIFYKAYFYDNNNQIGGIVGTFVDITERKNIESTLRTSEEKYRLLCEVTSDAGRSLLLQPDGTFKQEWSIDKLESKYGFSFKEIDTFEKWIQIVHPDDHKIFIEGKNKLLKGENVCVDLRIKTKNGELRWIQNNIWPMQDQQTGKTRLLSAIKDITERKQAEILQLESEEKLQVVFNNMEFGIIQSNGTIGFDMVNQSLIKMLGYSHEELNGMKIYDITANEDLHEELEKFNNTIHQRLPGFSIDKRFIKKDGSHLWCRVNYHLLYDQNKHVKNVLAVVQDISDQHKTVQALQESEETYRTLAENTEDIIFRFNTNYKIIFVNGAIEKFYPYKKDDLIDKSFQDLKPDELFNHLEEYGLMILKTQHPIRTTLKSIIQNREIFFSCRFYPEFDHHQKIQSILAVYSDITELIRIEQELIKAKEKAEEADRLKSLFLSNMSHEIRTPMNAIVGFSTLLGNEQLSHEIKTKYTKIIANSAEHLLTLISDILDISKIEAGQLEMHETAFDLHQMLHDIHEQFELQKITKEKEHILIQPADPYKSEFIIFTDDVRLQQILSNLMSNALKFIKKGYIEFGYHIIENMEDSFLQFFVKDTGIGIADDKKDIIFERFRQEEESLTTKHGGAGLGLAICKGIIELMGGKIWMESIKDSGTTFFFTIQLKFPPTTEINLERIEIPNIDHVIFINKTLLIVEDTIDINEFIKEILSPTKVSLILASTGTQALEHIRNNTEIDMILMDIRLPDINGLELINKIKEIRNIPVIAQTAFAQMSDRQRILHAGFDDYITKPIDRKQLLNCIAKHLKDNNGQVPNSKQFGKIEAN